MLCFGIIKHYYYNLCLFQHAITSPAARFPLC